MSPSRPAPVPIGSLLVAASLTLGVALAPARASEDGTIAIVRANGLARTPPAALAALRMDNYVDIVDGVLNARVRTRRPVPPEDGAAALDDTRPTSPTPEDGDTLFTSRAARPPRLPAGPLVVTTTAAFTGREAPAGAASWPPARGRLSISAADGSRIELDADNGDIASVEVTIVSGTRLHAFREPWATWAPFALHDR